MSGFRQLSAILFADIEGFTRSMQSDEHLAHQLQEKFRKALQREIPNHNGRIIQINGDGALCMFKSNIEAVYAAINLQTNMREHPEVPLRIGIHTGDVVFEGEDIYGDGVNVASRVESFAVAGGIFISERVYEDLKNQKDIQTTPLGTFEFKNVLSPVKIYAISNSGLKVPPQKMLEGKGKIIRKWSNRSILLFTVFLLLGSIVIFVSNRSVFTRTPVLLDKSIAVLPFENLSDNKEDEYFTVGMTDEILERLSKIGGLKVVSKTSTQQYKRTTKTAKEIGAELGVHVLLEGSVRKVGDQLHVIVQLINAKTDLQIWSTTYNRQLSDVFEIQSDIARQIASELDYKLTTEEIKRVGQKPTKNLQAYQFYLKGNNYTESYLTFESPNDLDKFIPSAVLMYQSAIKLDKKFVEPYAALISLYSIIYFSNDNPQSYIYLSRAKSLLDTLLNLKIDKPVVHYASGIIKFMGERDYSGALKEFEKANTVDPNNTDILQWKGYVYRRMGKFDLAVENFNKVLDRNPNGYTAYIDLAQTYMIERKTNEALNAIDKAIMLKPYEGILYAIKVEIYNFLVGDFEDGRHKLDSAKLYVDSNVFADSYLDIDILEGNYNSALNKLLQYPDSINYYHFDIIPYAQLIALIYNAQGNKLNADKYFRHDLELLLARSKITTDDFRIFSALGIAYAGLGQRQLALDNANRSVAMMPLSLDALLGTSPLCDLAVVYVLLGEQKKAISILEELIKLPAFTDGSTGPALRGYPQWVPIRNTESFQKLLEKTL